MSDLNHKLQQARELLDQGRFSQARDVLQRLVRVAPGDRHVNVMMRHALSRLGETQQALYYAKKALDTSPDDPELITLHAMTLADSGQLVPAVAALEACVNNHPSHALAIATLARMYGAQDRLGDCLRLCVRALERGVRDARVVSMYAGALTRIGRADEALPFMRDIAAATAQSSGMADPMQLSAIATAMLYDYSARPEDVYSAHYAFGRVLAQGLPVKEAEFKQAFDPERRLRLGFVGGDFRRHSSNGFVRPLLEKLDRSRVEICLYSTLNADDEVAHGFREVADHWVDVSRISMRELAQRMRNDHVDIAVDLSGHLGGNRTITFHLRTAPVQIAWRGYPTTTGIDAMDYRITDTLAAPEGAERFHTEKLLRIDPLSFCWRPDASPEIEATPPSERPGATGVTFISLSAAPKLNGVVLTAWARVLKEVRGSSLIVRHRSLANQDVRRHVAERLSLAGASPDRVRIEEPLPDSAAAMRAYADADVALDTWPTPGLTTTCEALWMGVPVIGVRRQSCHARAADGVIHAAGLDDLRAASEDEFVKAAVALAGDAARRRDLRATLRARLESSALRDESGFARKFEGALRGAWRTRCEAAALHRS